MTIRTYVDVIHQIEQLRAEAAELMAAERAQAIMDVREVIRTHALTAAELGFIAARRRPRFGGYTDTTGSGAPLYQDSQGNTWRGRGARPKWLREALAQGKRLADFMAS